MPTTPTPTTAPTPAIEEITGANGRRLWTARWPPATSPPRAAVLLLHGYAEHIGRYDHVVSALTTAAYAVYGLDHHGHGRSAGRRSSCRRFDDYVDDAETLLDRVLTGDPARPVVLYGHSMGGLIATRLALRRQDDLAGLIATSAAYRVGDDTSPIAKALAPVIARLLPDLPVVAPTPVDILSRDPAIGARFAADPLCYQGRTRAGLGYAMLTAGQETRARAAELTLPLLIMHGAADQLTSPAGSQEVHARAQSPAKTLRLWPDNRHELHNDLDHPAVIAAILAWLDANVAVSRGVRREENDDDVSGRPSRHSAPGTRHSPRASRLTPLCDLLAIDHPIVQAGMSAYYTNPELVAAVSAAGGLGVLGCLGRSADQTVDDLRHIRELTDRPFGVNFVVHRLDPDTFAAGLDARPAVFAFFRGDPEAVSRAIDRAKATGARVLYQATTVAEAEHALAAGADALIAQGREAGGHMGPHPSTPSCRPSSPSPGIAPSSPPAASSTAPGSPQPSASVRPAPGSAPASSPPPRRPSPPPTNTPSSPPNPARPPPPPPTTSSGIPTGPASTSAPSATA